MKSIYIPEPGKVEIREEVKPARKNGEALLKLLYGGLCGTDLNSYRGTAAYTKYPCLPGHEFAAKIVEIDENEYDLKAGMTVICNPYFNCGECYSCRRGLVNACVDNQTMGVQRKGAFSEFITMPVERIYDGKGLPARTLTLIEPFCISYHIVQRTKVTAGDNVLIVGAGAIGVLAAIAAKAKGANVTICDIAEEKLSYASKTFGIQNTFLNSDHDTFMNGVNHFTNGNGFDVSIDAAGFPLTFKNCIEALAHGGRMGLSGYSKDLLNDFDYSAIQKRELNILGCRNAVRSDFEELIDLVIKEKIELEKLITNEYNYMDVGKAFDDFNRNAGSMLKVVLKFA